MTISLPVLPTVNPLTTVAISNSNAAPQRLEISDQAESGDATRDGYVVTQPLGEDLQPYLRTADTFVNDLASPVQWPFEVGVPVSSEFGYRTPPCDGCSAYHRGVDLTPGIGTPIRAMADGVVTLVNTDGTYGEHIIIEHRIDGQTVESLYAHMLAGSTALKLGQQVKVGDTVGLVGNTGLSTGAHLHFEIRPDGEPVDPFLWLPPRIGS